MSSDKSAVVICTYRVKRGKEPEFRKLLREHWPLLNRLGLVEDSPRLILRSRSAEAGPEMVEVFAWKPGGFEKAHKLPAVLAVWEPMEQMCESRGGRPAMEFPHFEIIAP
jgi:hypothetical protein